jgi:hypothetical protein
VLPRSARRRLCRRCEGGGRAVSRRMPSRTIRISVNVTGPTGASGVSSASTASTRSGCLSALVASAPSRSSHSPQSAAFSPRTRVDSRGSVLPWRLQPVRPNGGFVSHIRVSISIKVDHACRPFMLWRPSEPPRAGFPTLPSLRAVPKRQPLSGWAGRHRDPTEAIDDAEHDLAILDRLIALPGESAGAARYLLTTNPWLGRFGPAISTGANPGQQRTG